MAFIHSKLGASLVATSHNRTISSYQSVHNDQEEEEECIIFVSFYICTLIGRGIVLYSPLYSVNDYRKK